LYDCTFTTTSVCRVISELDLAQVEDILREVCNQSTIVVCLEIYNVETGGFVGGRRMCTQVA